MISYLNVKQLEALTEIPSSLVINRNGTPNGTIFFKKLNKSAEPYYKIIEYLKKLTIPTIETYADISYIIGEICSQPRNKKSNVSRWLVISSKCYMNSYSLSIAPSWDSRQVTVEVHLEDIPNRVFLWNVRTIKAEITNSFIIFIRFQILLSRLLVILLKMRFCLWNPVSGGRPNLNAMTQLLKTQILKS